MRLDAAEPNSESRSLGLATALMIAAGYYGELVVTGDFSPSWICWLVSMILASYIIYELLVGPASETEEEAAAVAKAPLLKARSGQAPRSFLNR